MATPNNHVDPADEFGPVPDDLAPEQLAELAELAKAQSEYNAMHAANAESEHRAEREAAAWFGEADAPPPIDSFREIRARYHAFTSDEQLERIHAAGAQRYLVAGMLPLRATAMIVGDSGIGKSALLCQLGLCVAAGIPFFGHTTTQGRVLFFDYENNIEEAHKMARTIAEFLGLSGVPKDFISWNAHDAPMGWDNSTSLFSMIREIRPKLAIIDTLSKAFPEVEEKNSDASTLLTHLTALVSQIEGDILASHHFKKNMPKKFASLTAQDKMKYSRGASSLFNGVDLRLVVAPPNAAKNIESIEDMTPVECCFEISGFRRLGGEIDPIAVERVKREGDALGYRRIVGVTRLRNPRYQQVFEALPDPFRYKDVETYFPNSNSSVETFIKACRAAKKITEVEMPVTPGYRSRRGYKKVAEEPQREPVPAPEDDEDK